MSTPPDSISTVRLDRLGDDAHDQLVHGGLGAPVPIVGGVLQPVAAHPFAQREGAAADGLLSERFGALFRVVLLRHDIDVAELGKKRSAGLGHAQGDRVLVVDRRLFKVDDVDEGLQVGAGHRLADRVEDVVGGQRVAVVEDDPVADVQHQRGVVGVLPALGDAGDRFAVGAERQQGVEHLHLEVGGGAVVFAVGVHRGGLVGDRHDEGVLAARGGGAAVLRSFRRRSGGRGRGPRRGRCAIISSFSFKSS